MTLSVEPLNLLKYVNPGICAPRWRTFETGDKGLFRKEVDAADAYSVVVHFLAPSHDNDTQEQLESVLRMLIPNERLSNTYQTITTQGFARFTGDKTAYVVGILKRWFYLRETLGTLYPKLSQLEIEQNMPSEVISLKEVLRNHLEKGKQVRLNPYCGCALGSQIGRSSFCVFLGGVRGQPFSKENVCIKKL